MDGARGTAEGVYPLICTTGDDVLGNVRKSLTNYLREHGGPKRCVIATTTFLTPQRRRNIIKAASVLGVTVVNIHDGEDFVGRLYVDHRWRLELLGVTGNPPALSKLPPNPRRISSSILIGRQDDLQWLQSTPGDLLLTGQPGSGKTHLHQSWADTAAVLFVVSEDSTAIANAIRAQSPAVIVVDDAHVRLNLLGLLRRLRLEIGASFRIHANCWPTSESDVVAALETGPGQVRRLKLLPRKVMASLIESQGIGGPDVLIKLLLDQSGGKPGLCAALVEACKRDGVERVWTGEVLAEHLLVGGKLIRDELDRELLARFALGGKSGVGAMSVASRMAFSLSQVRSRVAGLGAGGVVVEVDDGRLAITPPSLDGVLVRDVFFAGLVRLDVEAALADCVSFKEATHVLLGAAQRGAKIDRHLIRSRVAQANSADLWHHYTYLDDYAARDVIDNFPDHVCDAGEGLLEQIPARALPALLRADQQRLITNEGDNRHPRELIRSWLSPWEQEEKSAARRALLLDALETLEASEDLDDDTLVKYLSECIHPRVHGHRTSPVERNTIILRKGVHPETTLRELAAVWPRIVKLLPVGHARAWSRFYDALSEWAWPARGGDSVSEAQAKFMHAMAREMVGDLLAKLGDDRVHLHQIRWINQHADLGLQVPEPDTMAKLFEKRLHIDPWEVGLEQRDVQLEKLAAELAATGLESASITLSELERDFETGLIHGGHDRGRLYGFIAESVDDPVRWCYALIEQELPAQFIVSFLQPIAAREPDRLREILQQLLTKDRYRETAVQAIVNAAGMVGDLVDSVIDELEPLEKDNEYRFRYDNVPIAAMLRLMAHPNADVRTGAAIGEWNHSTDHLVRPELLDSWRRAIVSANPKHDGVFNDLFAAHPEVGRAWAEEKIANAQYGLWHHRRAIHAIAPTLNSAERFELLTKMNSEARYDRQWFDVLLAGDMNLFSRWLDQQADAKICALPVCRKPSDHWPNMLVIALDHGVSEDRIIGSIGAWSDSWSGSAAEHFHKYQIRYKGLMQHEDVRIRRIAARGLEWASQRVVSERRREEGENFD